MGLLTGHFDSSDGKSKIAYRIREPEGDVRGVVQISHGMAEHISRYAPFADYLAQRGFVCGGNDHLGHGDSCPDTEDLGFFSEADGVRKVISDLHSMTEILKEKYPDKPIFLLGHSMGSFLARLYLSNYAEDLTGAIVMGTAGPGSPVGLALWLCGIVSAFRGDMHRSKFINKIAFGSYNKKIKNPQSPFDWLSKDRDEVAKYDADPLCGFGFTVSGFRDLFSMIGECNTAEWAATVPTDLPVLVVSGADDPVGNYGAGPAKVAGMLGAAGSVGVTLKLFPGDRHEILNETDRDDVFSYISGWLEECLAEAEEEEN